MTSAMVATLVSVLLVAPPTAEPVPVQRPGAGGGSPVAPVEAPPPTVEPAPPPVEAAPVEAAPVEAAPVEPAPVGPAPVEAAPVAPPVEAESAVTPEGAIAPPPVIDREMTEDEIAAATPSDADRREEKMRRAQIMVAGGSIAAIAGFVMLIAAGVERAKPACKFGLDDCPNAPRPNVAMGLGIGGAIALVGGAALLTVGAIRLGKLRASFAADNRSAGIVLVGRF